VLVAFSTAGAARELSARGSSAPAVATSEIARLFGAGFEPADAIVSTNWSDERWSGGGYAASFPPGALTAAGPGLRQPEGRLHWAGAETSESWPNFMEGAVRAGHRAADEVLVALDADAPLTSAPRPTS